MQGKTILVSGETDFKPKLIRRDGEGCHTLIKGKVYPEDLAVLTIYAADTGAPKFAKLALVQLKSHIHPHAVRVVTSLLYSHQQTDHPDKN